MITVDDLKKHAQFRGILFLDMSHGAYENHYRSDTYPRLEVVKEGRRGKKPKNYTTIYVDGVACRNLEEAVARLNTAIFEKK